MVVDRPGTTAPSRRGDTYGGRSRPERAAERRERIVAAAVRLFAARDYDEVTVAEVCTHAKVAKRYFYDHFADRADLLLAVHREQNDWLLAGITAAAPDRPAGVEELLRPVMRALVELLQAHPDRARVIYINAPRMERRRRNLMHRDAEVLARLFRRKLGRPRDKALSDRMLLALVAGVTELIIDWLNRGMTDGPDVLADHLTHLGVAVLGDLH